MNMSDRTHETAGICSLSFKATVCTHLFHLVIPAKAGIHGRWKGSWIPAFAGMTKEMCAYDSLEGEEVTAAANEGEHHS
jgi:hypothetical protein